MRTSEYGKTGKQVSAIGFGGMRFDMSKSLEANAELLLYAQAKGINYFDSAPHYCDGKGEEIFGIALKQMRGEYFVSTKGMPTQFDTAAKARQAVEESLRRLQVDKIDFYHVWCLRKMEHYELAMRPGGQYEGLLACQQEGLIDHIVCSTHQPGAEVRQVLADGHFAGVLLGVNILNFPYRWDGIEAAQEFGCGVVVMNPLAGGAIPRHESQLQFLAEDGETPTEAALRFVVAAPQINVVLPGFSCQEHIDVACAVAASATPVPATQRQRLQARLGANLNAMCTGCGYCVNCPQAIAVPSYMQCYNEHAVFGKSDAQMVAALPFMREYGMLAGSRAAAAACIECGQCQQDCTQHLPIVERLRQFAVWEQACDEQAQ